MNPAVEFPGDPVPWPSPALVRCEPARMRWDDFFALREVEILDPVRGGLSGATFPNREYRAVVDGRWHVAIRGYSFGTSYTYVYRAILRVRAGGNAPRQVIT